MELEATRFKGFRGTEDGFEVFLRALTAADHDSYGKRDFRIDDVLRQELFGQVLGDESVVLRAAQKRSDPFEGVQETEKVCVGVTAARFFFCDRRGMASGELRNDGGADAAFEVKVQLGFGCGQDVLWKWIGSHERSE